MINSAITNGQIKLGHVYHFRNKAYPKYVLNVWSDSNYPQAKLSNVCLWEYDKTDIAQKWVVTSSTRGAFIQPLKGSSFDLYLDRYTGSGAGAGINAHLFTKSDTSLFDIQTASQDSVKIKVVDKNLYLTAYGGTNGKRTGKTAKSEGNVFFAANSNSPTQEWIPVAVKKYYWPTKGTALSRGFSTGSNGTTKHDGVDIKGSTPGVAGDKVYAYMDGYVSFVGTPDTSPKEGYTVRIHHKNPLKDDNGYARIRTQYMHLNSMPLVNKFDKVNAGDLIGYMGNTGNSTGVHLHFEVRGGTESNFPLGGASSNGFNTGTVIDPTPYLKLTGADF